MADRPEPYVKRAAGDVIRADHWNEAQVRAREDIGAHDHTGGLGAPIPREGILEKPSTAHASTPTPVSPCRIWRFAVS